MGVALSVIIQVEKPIGITIIPNGHITEPKGTH